MKRLFLLLGLVACSEPPPPPPPPAPSYEIRVEHDPDGIGKFYMGREIAHVISGPGATAWLDRPEREQEEDPGKLVDLLELRPDMVVADVGAGTGYVSFRMAPLVKKVIAQDVQSAMLKIVTDKAAKLGIRNVETALGTIKDANLPAASVDLVLMVDVYHEFEFPFEMMMSIRKGLRPGGRVVFVEYRGEDLALAIKPVHKMTEAQVRREMEYIGLRFLKKHEELPRQRVLVFVQ